MVKIEDVMTKLESLGYKAKDSDTAFIQLAINGVEQHIRNFCHVMNIPDELYYTAVEMAAGTLLKTKLSVGEKINDLIDFEVCNVASVTEGDVSVSYNNNGDNSVAWFTSLLDRLCNRDNDLLCFRKVKW